MLSVKRFWDHRRNLSGLIKKLLIFYLYHNQKCKKNKSSNVKRLVLSLKTLGNDDQKHIFLKNL